MKKRLFIKNAVIMTITSFVLRAIGIVFRVYISNRVGAEGMGLYQLILSVYVLTSSFAVAGLNTAVTRLCTDELARGREYAARRILSIGIALAVWIGIISAIALISSAVGIADVFIKDERSIPSLYIMTVGLPFMGASSCIKGYFLAKRKVTSSSIAQILEQLVRIIAILFILNVCNIHDVTGACFAVMLGDTIAEAASCLFMITSYMLDKHKSFAQYEQQKQQRGIIRKLIAIAAPITGGRYLNSGLRTVENFTVPSALAVYYGVRETALEQFGKLKGMALPLIFFPSSFLMAIASLLIPEISEANALGNRRQLHNTVERTMQITLQSSVLLSGCFWVLGELLGQWIYNDIDVGRMMRILAPLAPFMYTECVVVGMLKGLNQQTHSLVYSVVDSITRIVCVPLLLTKFGMNGFYGIMVISNLLTCYLNTARLFRVCDMRFLYSKWIFRPTLVMAISIIITQGCNGIWSVSAEDPTAYVIVNGGFLCLLYLLGLWITKAIDYDDLVVILPAKFRKKTPAE